MRRKIKFGLLFSSLAIGTMLLAGCGNNQATTMAPAPQAVAPDTSNSASTPVNSTAADNSVSTATPDANLPSPPAPTGKVDDTVNAIEQGAGAESTQATSDTTDAQAATDNSSNGQAASGIGAGL